MAKLTIGEKTVTVDDSFLKMSPEEQQSTVDEIEKGIGAQAPKSYDLADIPSAAVENAPADAAGIVQGAVDMGKEAYKGLTERSIFTKGFKGFDIPLGINPQGVKDKIAQYDSIDKVKTAVAEHPVSTALDVAGIIPAVPKLAAVTKGTGSVARGLKSINKSKVDYPEVSGDVARDLKLNHETGDYKLPRFAENETKEAVNKLHTNYKAEIDTDYATISHMLDPKKAIDEVDRLKRVEAEKAFRSGDHLRMDKSLRSEIDAVDSLVGHTKEGLRIVNNLKKQVEVGRLGSKVKGGVSQFTDELNPLSTGGGRFGIKGLPQVATAANIGAAGFTGGVNLIAQGAAVTGGRLIDLVTKRGSLPRKYMKDNAKAPASPPTDGLVDVAQQTRQAAALAEQEVRLVKATREKEALQAKVEKVKTSQAKETFKEASAENKRYDDVVAAAKRKQQAAEALAKKQEPKAPKQDFGISPLAVARVKSLMQQKAVETAKLEKAVEKGAKAEAKANAPKDPTAPRSQVRDTVLYEAGRARIIAQQNTVIQAANTTKLPSLRKLLTEAEADLKKSDAKGGKNHKRRVEIYEATLAKAKTAHERASIIKNLKPLAFTFSGKK